MIRDGPNGKGKELNNKSCWNVDEFERTLLQILNQLIKQAQNDKKSEQAKTTL